ncbi:TetR/AcrR family transcriptional regulator [Photobacterium makurazakiensis]|uniref:TetR/AcrR family transcriptional regulator n=1 Tax=Photobacterium makurazakiensis TaxID=2910234 RepID=UPI003D0DF6D1
MIIVATKKSEKTAQRIIDSTLEMVEKKGWEQVSFTNLSQSTGISRSGITRLFPYRKDLFKLVCTQIPIVIDDVIDFTNEETIWESWIIAMKSDEKFINYMNAILVAQFREESREGMKNFVSLFEGRTADLSLESELIYCLLGKFVLFHSIDNYS